MAVMRFDHPQWHQFLSALEVSLNPHFPPDNPRAFRSNCKHDHTLTRSTLKGMGFADLDIEDSIAFLCACGGCCDCEVILNVPSKEGAWRQYPDQGAW